MPYLLEIRLQNFEKNANIPLICNHKHIYNKKSTRDAESFKNTAYVR